MALIEELKRYYRANGISAADFRCKHCKACKGDSEDFSQAREAFVGREYERGTLPRLLFVSLDPGESYLEDDRTIEGMRAWEAQSCNVATLPKGRHWYRTHELAWILLRKFQPDLLLEHVHDYFAHTNSAKCCLNKAGRSQADYRLFYNCREYIPGELVALQPDIIISQGDMAKAAIQAGIPPFRLVTEEGGHPCGHKILEINRQRVLWLHTYHPRFFGGFNFQRRECFERWADLSYQFARGAS